MPDLAAEAHVVLDQACRRAHLDPSGAALLRLRSNAVFRLKSSPVVVRITRSAAAPTRMPTVLRMTRWLHGQGFPTVRPADLEQPLQIDGATITFWEYLPAAPDQKKPTTTDLGTLLRRLHSLPEPPFELPVFNDPLRSIRHDVLHRPGILSPYEQTWLTELIEERTHDWNALPALGAPRILHGDAWIDNLLLHADGHPVLHDWDSVALGDTPWDLIHTYHGRYRFGLGPQDVDMFALTYGYDLRDWAGFTSLMQIRDLYATGIHVRNAPGDPFSRHELQHRLASIKDGDTTRQWRLRS